MTILLNGEKTDFPQESILTVGQLLARLELGPAPVLVELDGKALYSREFETAEVRDGSVVEVIRMVAGG